VVLVFPGFFTGSHGEMLGKHCHKSSVMDNEEG
jgi:hypothetical protein